MREVHVQHVKVKAKNKKYAIERVKDGDGDYLEFEYSHTLDSGTWTVAEEK